MRLLLTDDRKKLRLALKRLLAQEPELNVVGEVVHANDLLTQAQKLRPDLVLLNWELPGFQADDLRVVRHCRTLKVVAFGENCDARQAALDAGADAFVSREEPPEALLTTLPAVAGLSPWFSG